MGTYVAPAPAIRTSRILVGLIAFSFVGALALGVALASRAISFDSPTTNDSQGDVTGTIIRSHPGAGYPPHYGLAGPSQLGTTDAPIGIGPGYPPHYGLAGPSQLEGG
jgi:hypothetical protein